MTRASFAPAYASVDFQKARQESRNQRAEQEGSERFTKAITLESKSNAITIWCMLVCQQRDCMVAGGGKLSPGLQFFSRLRLSVVTAKDSLQLLVPQITGHTALRLHYEVDNETSARSYRSR